MLRAVDSLRLEHKQELEREKEQMREERKRMEAWMHDVKEGFKRKTERLHERIAGMEGDGTPRADVVGVVAGRTTHVRTETAREAENLGVGGNRSLSHTDGLSDGEATWSESESPKSSTEMEPGGVTGIAGGGGDGGLGEKEEGIAVGEGEGEGDVDEVGKGDEVARKGEVADRDGLVDDWVGEGGNPTVPVSGVGGGVGDRRAVTGEVS